jgi:Fe2+ or Zn2+ uptake regulation protein
VTSIRDIFARHGLRCTPQRRAIYQALCNSTAHPTAEALHRQVRMMTDSVSLATVYNTLDALAEAGLVHRIPSENGSCRYDANVDEHLHLRIAETGEIRDVPHDLSKELLRNIPRDVIEKIELATGSRIESIDVQLVARRAHAHTDAPPND